jgi:hypothetical protein
MRRLYEVRIGDRLPIIPSIAEMAVARGRLLG